MAEKVKITNRSKITRVYSKGGTCIETVIESCTSVPKDSLKHKQALALEMLQKMVDDLEISWASGNALATVIKNPKRRRWAKRVKEKEYLTGKPHSVLKFKRTLKTSTKLLLLQKKMLADPSEYGIQDEQVEKLKEHFTNDCRSFIYRYPQNALKSPTLVSMLCRSTRLLRRWYCDYTHTDSYGADKIPLEKISSFFKSELQTHGLLKNAPR